VFGPGLGQVRVGFLFSRYGYVSRDPNLVEPDLENPSRILRKSKRREKSRAGMVRTYSGSTP
jgi:hypothetical protein